jgi:deoxyribodipyrimidine photo-lyase
MPEWTTTIDAGELTTLATLGHPNTSTPISTLFGFEGGESAGLSALERFLEGNRQIENYHQHQQEIQLESPTAHLSPWLALGCLSPKYVYARLRAYETTFKKNKATQEFLQSLLVRDHLRLQGKKYGNRIFEQGGVSGRETKDLVTDTEKLTEWINGQTPAALINAMMRQLASTGYLAPKGRALVASYLVNDMKVDWRMGAAYFQHILIDYDICSNWVNWNIIGGVGADPKEEKPLILENQQKRLDPHATYIHYWENSKLEQV